MLTRILPVFRGHAVVAAAILAALFACGDVDDVTGEPASGVEVADDPVSEGLASTPSVKKTAFRNTTLWADKLLVRETLDGVDRFVLRGRTSRTLTGGLAFVCDDLYGEFTQRSPRTFAVGWTTGEAAGLLNAVDQFVRLDFVTRPASLTAHFVMQPQLTGFTGSGAYLDARVRPVLVRGGLVAYRISGSTRSHLYGASVRVDKTYFDVVMDDAKHFHVDLTTEEAVSLAATPQELVVTVSLLSGSYEKRARLVLAVDRMELTDQDPYDRWPGVTCTDVVEQCLRRLPTDTLDTAACGDYRNVDACAQRVGVFVSAADLDAAVGRAQTLFLDPDGLAADAPALAGFDQAVTLVDALLADVTAKLRNQSWRWYLGSDGIRRALDLEIQAAIDRAYATPLALVPRHWPAPGDLGRARNVAADALLEYVATHDPRGAEWGRSLVELTRVYRDQYVKDMHAWREQVEPVADPSGSAVNDVYVGEWLGAYVEMYIERATGVMVGMLFEVD